MKSIIFLLALGAFGCGGDKNKKSSESIPIQPTVPVKPAWAGNCDTDYSTLHTENLTAHNVVIDDRGIDKGFKTKYLNELNILPMPFLKLIGTERVPVRMTNGGVSNFEELSSVKGKPVDSSNSTYTWDDVAGLVTDYGVFLGTVPAGSNSVSIHETGHVIDLLVELSLQSAHLKETFNFYKTNPSIEDERATYRMSNIYEFFAVGFDDFYCNKKSRDDLKKLYPKLHDYFELEAIDEVTTLPVKIKFKP